MESMIATVTDTRAISVILNKNFLVTNSLVTIDENLKNILPSSVKLEKGTVYFQPIFMEGNEGILEYVEEQVPAAEYVKIGNSLMVGKERERYALTLIAAYQVLVAEADQLIKPLYGSLLILPVEVRGRMLGFVPEGDRWRFTTLPRTANTINRVQDYLILYEKNLKEC